MVFVSMNELVHLLELEDIEALLNSLPTGDDYSPFQSKIHALSYMLLHSPRPLVGVILCLVYMYLF